MGPSPIPPGVEVKGGGLKTVLLILLAVIVVGGVGALAYFVVFPLLFPPSVPVTAPPPVQVPSLAQHKSFLVSPPAAEAEIKLADRSYLTIITALQSESFTQLADGQFKEVKISDNRGQVPFAGFLGGITPAATALGVQDWFEDDFTAVLYYDPNGAWPLYAARLKDGVDAATVASGFKQIESVLDTANFYLTTPGSFAEFKDGKIGNYATRYSVGTQLGASFNYGVFGRFFVISTNFNGLKVALPLLGL